MRWEPRSLNPLSEQVPVLGDRVGDGRRGLYDESSNASSGKRNGRSSQPSTQRSCLSLGAAVAPPSVRARSCFSGALFQPLCLPGLRLEEGPLRTAGAPTPTHFGFILWDDSH